MQVILQFTFETLELDELWNSNDYIPLTKSLQ